MGNGYWAQSPMKDICIELSYKIDININNIYLLYNGNVINVELKYNEIINRIDNERNIMNILIYDKEKEIICPNCEENINIDKDEIINEIIKNNNKINNIFNRIKEKIKNMINNKDIINIIMQLQNIINIIDNIKEDMRRNNEEINKLYNIFNNIREENIIEGIINIEDLNKDIILYNSKEDIDLYINNEIRINENKYKFDKKELYKYKLIFKNKITNIGRFCENCSLLYSINLSNFNTFKY